MPRKGTKKKRLPQVDPIYKNRMISSFINRMMKGGKKSVAERMLYGALEEIKAKISEEEAVDVFKKAVKNTSPVVKVKARRIGGSTYQVPMEVSPHVSEAMSHRWLIDAARKRSGKTFSQKLAAEVMDAFNNTGTAVRKKEETHKMADANKAFAHYGKY